MGSKFNLNLTFGKQKNGYVIPDNVTLGDDSILNQAANIAKNAETANAGDSAAIAEINAKLEMLASMINNVRAESFTTTENVADINDASKNFTLTSDITGTAANLVANSIAFKSMNITDTTAVVSANEFTADGCTFTGNKQTSSNLIALKNPEYITFSNMEFSGKTYNTIMTGQQSTVFNKYMSVKNCNFNENCKHVNIWYSGFQENAVLDINKCVFGESAGEQILCISDYHNSESARKLTVNVTDCEIKHYDNSELEDYGYNYAGFILLDSRSTTSEEDFLARKPFSNVVINFKNVTVLGQKLTKDNFKMGSADANQMLYIFCAKSKKVYTYAEHPELFPTINFLD